MWHPPSDTNKHNTDQLSKQQVEEERLVQLAVMKSLEDQMIDKPPLNTSIPEIVEVSSQIFSTLALEDSIYNLEGQNTNTDLEKRDAENPCLTELISSYITATDSLIGEIKKDFVSDQTLTENF